MHLPRFWMKATLAAHAARSTKTGVPVRTARSTCGFAMPSVSILPRRSRTFAANGRPMWRLRRGWARTPSLRCRTRVAGAQRGALNAPKAGSGRGARTGAARPRRSGVPSVDGTQRSRRLVPVARRHRGARLAFVAAAAFEFEDARLDVDPELVVVQACPSQSTTLGTDRAAGKDCAPSRRRRRGRHWADRSRPRPSRSCGLHRPGSWPWRAASRVRTG